MIVVNSKEHLISQIIAYKNQNGITLAADSHAVDFDLKGQMVGYGIMRLYQLTHSTAILIGGNAAGANCTKNETGDIGR